MKAVAFFDVDNTLIKGYSGYYATLELIRRGIIKKRRLLQALYYQLLSPIYYGNVRKMYEIAIRDMAGSSLEKILEIGEEVFQKKIKHCFYIEALEKIQDHRLAQDRIALISSGPYMIVKAIADYLKVDTLFAVGPVVQNKILQNRLETPFCFQEGKLQLAQDYVQQLDVSLDQCSFYSDSIQDLLLLKAVGYPKVVNPDFSLKGAALKYKWPILNFKTLVVNC